MSNKLVFVTIVNEVETVQGMINLTKISPVMTKEAFKLFSKMIEKGDHICTLSLILERLGDGWKLELS